MMPKARLCSKKPMKGPIPLPAPIIMRDAVGSVGGWKPELVLGYKRTSAPGFRFFRYDVASPGRGDSTTVYVNRI